MMKAMMKAMMRTMKPPYVPSHYHYVPYYYYHSLLSRHQDVPWASYYPYPSSALWWSQSRCFAHRAPTQNHPVFRNSNSSHYSHERIHNTMKDLGVTSTYRLGACCWMVV